MIGAGCTMQPAFLVPILPILVCYNSGIARLLGRGLRRDRMSLLIDNVRLWDGTGAATQPRMAVEVREGRIAWVGPAEDWPGRRAHAEVVDGTARTLIPGLVDCHVHYSSPGGPDWI